MSDPNLELYKEYNKSLRTWLVAYGVALPALFITSKDAKDFLLSIPGYKALIAVFLIAVATQIVGTFLNKYVAWCAYHRNDCNTKGVNCSHFIQGMADLENSIKIDLWFDVITVLLFGVATIWLLLSDVCVN